MVDTALPTGGAPVATPDAIPARSLQQLLGDRAAAARRLVAPAAWLAFAVALLVPIALFLVIAFSPRLLSQGSEWFTLGAFARAFHSGAVQGMIDSLVVGTATAVGAVAIALPLAWLVQRTDLVGRRLWVAGIWVLLLIPSYLPGLAWERLLTPGGILAQMGIPAGWLRAALFGPAGVVLVLTMAGLPFAYLAISSALLGLGPELEEAARVHGVGRWQALRVVVPVIAPALWAAAAIVFAESLSDFGVAATLAASVHFPVATYTLFTSITSFPSDFPQAAVVAWMLLAGVAVPLALQARSTRRRSYAVLTGRARQVTRRRLGVRGQVVAVGALTVLFAIGIGVPFLGAVSGSLLAGEGGSFSFGALTLHAYRAALSSSVLSSPLLLSTELAVITASLTVALGFSASRILAAPTKGRSARLLDLVLLGAVALPGIVLGAGYIFTFNLPLLGHIGLDLYGTTTLLAMAYLAGAVPTTSRVMAGTVAQVPDSLPHAARVHGAGPLRAWTRGVLPSLSRPLVWAWLLTFAKTLLELPISQILYAPGHPPLSVAIQDYLSNYHYAEGLALSMLGAGFALAVIALGLGAYRLFAPRGWRQIGGAHA